MNQSDLRFKTKFVAQEVDELPLELSVGAEDFAMALRQQGVNAWQAVMDRLVIASSVMTAEGMSNDNMSSLNRCGDSESRTHLSGASSYPQQYQQGE